MSDRVENVASAQIDFKNEVYTCISPKSSKYELSDNESSDFNPNSSHICEGQSNFKKVKKQNKDEANASRTSRIVLYSIIEEENGKKEMIKLLNKIGFGIDDIKDRVRCMGEKEFVKTFLKNETFSPFFKDAFKMVDEKHIQKILRANKKSQLPYHHRINLVHQNIQKLHQIFEKVTEEKSVKEEVLIESFVILQPVPLNPLEYRRYMIGQGYLFSSI